MDRGSWGLETLLLFLAYKWLLPNNVYLLRGWVPSQQGIAYSTTGAGWGPACCAVLACLAVLSSTHCDSSLCLNFVICCCSNHEATFCTKHYGFRNELLAKYGKAGKVRAKEASAACAYKDPFKGSSACMLDTT